MTPYETEKVRTPARVLIVDDHPATREGLAFRIASQKDLQVAGQTSDVEDTLQLVAETKPDVAVIDICLKTGDGIDLIKRIKARGDPVRMLAWSMHDESLYAERALRAGALGYIDKSQSTETVIDAIRCVLDGKLYLSGKVAQHLLRHSFDGNPRLDQSPVSTLSDRELEVFRSIGQGFNTQEVARRMNVTAKTVDTYRSRIKDKLNLNSGTELMRSAVHWVLQSG